MLSPDTQGLRRKSDYVSLVAAAIVILGGSIALIGWLLQMPFLHSSIPGQVSMKANTALGFVLSGVLLFVARSEQEGSVNILRVLLEIAVLSLGALTLSEYLFNIDLSIDQVLAAAPTNAIQTTSPGRMAPTTAIAFILIALAMLVGRLPWRRALFFSRALLVVLFLVGLSAVLGYAYGAPLLYLGIDGVTATALPSAVLFIILAIGAFWLRPRRGFPALLAERSVAGTHARSLLPMVVGAPLLVGAAVAAGYGRFYEGQFAIALTSLGSVTAAGIVAIISVVVLRRAESALYIRDRALTATTNGVIITDHQSPDEPIVYVNNAFSSISGYTFEEAVGKNCRFMNADVENDAATMESLRNCLQTGEQGTFELRNRRKDGQLFWNRLSLAPVDDYGGTITHFVGILDDFTNYREQEQRVQSALDEARQANSMRDTFVRLVSHELRTPLNAALTWIRLMEVDERAETRDKGVKVVADSIESQSRLIEDLVDVSRFASAGVRLESEHVNARELIVATIDELRPGVEAQQSLTFNCIDANYGATLDPLRVRQIVRNLVSNASKYTPAGGKIEIDLRRDDSNLVFSVTDSGKGLTQDDIAQLFEPFWRAESSQPGLGVGLSIVAALVEAHNGSINVFSDGPDQGSTFVVRLPLDAAPSGHVRLQEEGTG